jgi:hypothetical protein
MTDGFRLPEPRTDVSLEFLQALYAERCDLAAIPPDGGRPEFRTFDADEWDQAEVWINEHQGETGLYYQVNQVRSGLRDRKATKADISKVIALHADIDNADTATLERILTFNPAPTIVVFSGGGHQPLWLLHEPTAEFDRAEQINKAIAQALEGDNCQNVDRLLRLPGTINLPNAKKRAAGRTPTLARIM